MRRYTVGKDDILPVLLENSSVQGAFEQYGMLYLIQELKWFSELFLICLLLYYSGRKKTQSGHTNETHSVFKLSLNNYMLSYFCEPLFPYSSSTQVV